VKWIIGNAKKMDLVSIITATIKNSPTKILTPNISSKSFSFPFAGIDPKHTRANIKIQDGCDFFCSYCEVPYARGRARSRNFNNIISEAKELTDYGYKELVITGINVGMYKQNNHTLIDVISALEQIDSLQRIRISSIELTTIAQAIIKKMSQKTKLCRYLHVPLQSASDRILKKMNRKYVLEDFKKFIIQAHKTVPQICLGTDVMVGFPSEEDKDFVLTKNYLEESPIQYFHVFSYSQRKLARSQQISSIVPKAIIQNRSKTLLKLSTYKRNLFHQSLLGTTQKILFEKKKNGFWNGLTDNYVRVQIKSQRNLSNKICPVTIQHTTQEKVFGSLLKE